MRSTWLTSARTKARPWISSIWALRPACALLMRRHAWLQMHVAVGALQEFHRLVEARSAVDEDLVGEDVGEEGQRLLDFGIAAGGLELAEGRIGIGGLFEYRPRPICTYGRALIFAKALLLTIARTAPGCGAWPSRRRRRPARHPRRHRRGGQRRRLPVAASSNAATANRPKRRDTFRLRKAEFSPWSSNMLIVQSPGKMLVDSGGNADMREI